MKTVSQTVSEEVKSTFRRNSAKCRSVNSAPHEYFRGRGCRGLKR